MFREKIENQTPVIDLTGPNGNVFYLIATAKKWAKQLSMDGKAIVNQMMSSDYENAVQTFEDAFGQYVILER